MIAFTVTASDDQSVELDGKFAFDHVVTTVGGGWQPATNDFVCPVSGHYMFAYSMTSSRGSGLWGRVVVDGVRDVRMFGDGINGNGYGSASHTYMVHCSQGKRVYMESHAAGETSVAYGYNHCSFSGVLIRADG